MVTEWSWNGHGMVMEGYPSAALRPLRLYELKGFGMMPYGVAYRVEFDGDVLFY